MRYTWFSPEISDLDWIDRNGVAEFVIGFGFFQNAGDPKLLGYPSCSYGAGRDIETKSYVRVSHGWWTDSSLNDTFSGDIEDDEFNNQMTLVFYDHPLTNSPFGLPIELLLTPGFGYYYSSKVQDSIPEYVLAIKGYYTITWPIRWRLGVTEGLSWVSEPTYIEQLSLDGKG
ncbi:MAG: outer membrane protein [Planctomycetota bacterium]